MSTRTITRKQADDWGLPHNTITGKGDGDTARAIELHCKQVDTRRWASVHELVFLAPDDDRTYRVHYFQPLTEQQEHDRWNFAVAVELVEVEPVTTSVVEWHPVGDKPEPTHQGPHPEHGGLETHRGRSEDCTGPDCGPAICLNCEHLLSAHGEEVCGQPSTFPDGTPYQCGCTWGDDDQDDAAEEATPAPAGDHFTEAAIRRSAYLDAASIAAEPGPNTCGCGGCAECARYYVAEDLRRRADHYTTAEQPTGPTWEARADHAIRLYATTAIERDDARAEAARLRAERATLIEQRDRITDDTIKALAAETPQTVTVGHVETALRAWLTDFDYDRHKVLQCGEDDGEDHYPDEAEAFFECLLAAAGQAARDAFEERIDAEVTAHGADEASG